MKFNFFALFLIFNVAFNLFSSDHDYFEKDKLGNKYTSVTNSDFKEKDLKKLMNDPEIWKIPVIVLDPKDKTELVRYNLPKTLNDATIVHFAKQDLQRRRNGMLFKNTDFKLTKYLQGGAYHVFTYARRFFRK